MENNNHSQAAKRVVLDVRPDIKSGREPFTKIMSTVMALQDGQELLLLAPFEPIPLFAVLKKQGFEHAALKTQAGDWEVLFSRTAAAKAIEPSHVNGTATSANNASPRTSDMSMGSDEPQIVKVDARGLEPPQPLVRILETLTNLPMNAKLHALTDRRPMHLYAHVEERGFSANTVQQPDGSFLTCIERIAADRNGDTP
jgi:uncharacterized protein (DUF2249 family)